MNLPGKPSNLRVFVRYGATLFIACMSLAYALHPHWLTFSHFAAKWYTLIPFVIAMITCALLLWHTGKELQKHNSLRVAGNALCASAVCAALIVCIPYTGSMTQKGIHNIIALLFVLLATFGIAWSGKRLRLYGLGAISAALLGICILELIFLARFDTHPVYPWVWVVLQITATLLLILGLYVIAKRLEGKPADTQMVENTIARLVSGGDYVASFQYKTLPNVHDVNDTIAAINKLYPNSHLQKDELAPVQGWPEAWDDISQCMQYGLEKNDGYEPSRPPLSAEAIAQLNESQHLMKELLEAKIHENAEIHSFSTKRWIKLGDYPVFWSYRYIVINPDGDSLLLHGSSSD